ncbi:heterokaryon incompatibility protein [Fusarium oxysporum f. sp. phaseoli]
MLCGSLVSIYANCALTNESARLIAMSGIAKRFQEANKDTYLAGLWKEVIHYDLTWRTNASEGAEVVRNESYAPTWSWASVVGGHTTLSALPQSDPTGLLRSAELDIECMPFYYRWTANSTRLAVYKYGTRSDCYFEEEFSSQNLQLDTTDMVRKFNEMSEMEGVCVPLCTSYKGYGEVKNVFIMLEHVSGTKFRRIGTFEYGEIGRWISDWYGSRTRITLV